MYVPVHMYVHVTQPWYKPILSIQQSKHVKHVILLILNLNMWKLDLKRPKHVIKINQN